MWFTLPLPAPSCIFLPLDSGLSVAVAISFDRESRVFRRPGYFGYLQNSFLARSSILCLMPGPRSGRILPCGCIQNRKSRSQTWVREVVAYTSHTRQRFRGAGSSGIYFPRRSMRMPLSKNASPFPSPYQHPYIDAHIEHRSGFNISVMSRSHRHASHTLPIIRSRVSDIVCMTPN